MKTAPKKGFTLIELMVVIVIIGILAAIAIPKLFGMSAKAKAQEVGPAVGTWVKLQQAYKMETGELGTPDKISYKAPGSLPGTPATGTTGNFEYTLTAEDQFDAISKFEADPCKQGSKWSASFDDANGDTPKMKIKVATGGGSNSTDAGCLSLTPNYMKIGCDEDGLDAAGNNPAIACQ